MPAADGVLPREREREQVHNFMSLETSGMQILPAKKCQFYEPSLLHTDFPLFYFVGGLALQVYTQGFCSFSA